MHSLDSFRASHRSWAISTRYGGVSQLLSRHSIVLSQCSFCSAPGRVVGRVGGYMQRHGCDTWGQAGIRGVIL